MLGPIGTQEFLLIALLILLLFGAKKIPQFARSLGRGMSEFKAGKREIESEIKDSLDEAKA
ncbi:MAG: twin-arginine translocase TatA/TatE family subunit [Verrucomicrobiales bacterium]|nr:twin-arginine translocase TatA/TatE family subunit [Verrucomicrobiales bacterium]